MARKLRPPRGTTAQNNSYTGLVGEITVDTEEKSLRVHDGSTAGGIKIKGSNLQTWTLEETGGDPITSIDLDASSELLAQLPEPKVVFPTISGNTHTHIANDATLSTAFISIAATPSYVMQNLNPPPSLADVIPDIVMGATGVYVATFTLATTASTTPSAGTHLGTVDITGFATSGNALQIGCVISNDTSGSFLDIVLIESNGLAIQTATITTPITLPTAAIEAQFYIDRDVGKIGYVLDGVDQGWIEDSISSTDFVISSDYSGFVLLKQAYCYDVPSADAYLTSGTAGAAPTISLTHSINPADASYPPSGIVEWLSAVMVYPPAGVSAGSVYEISNPDGLSYLGYIPNDGDLATFGSDLVNVGWAQREPTAYVNDAINGEAILWSAFAALDPNDYSLGKRFRITDQGSIIVQHDGTRFVQQSPRLPKMAYANLPSAAEKWRGWSLRVTDYGGVNVMYTGAAWQATGQFCLHSSGGHTHTGDTTETPLVVPSVPHDLLGLGATIDYFLRRGTTTSSSTLRVRPTPTASSITGTAVSEIAAATGQCIEKAINYDGSDSLVGAGELAGIIKTISNVSGVTVSGSFSGQIIYMPVTCQLTDAANTFTLLQCTFWCNPGPFVEV